MSNFSLGDRYDWRGDKHGPWRRETGGLRIMRAKRLPIRQRYNSGPTPRHAVLDLLRLLNEEPLAWPYLESLGGGQ